jgi:lysophospholipid hydrolase
VETVRVPSMGELGQRLIWVYSSKQQQKIEDNCDLFLAPPVHEYGTLDYHLFDDIYQLGYDYSKPKIEAFIKENRWVVPE